MITSAKQGDRVEGADLVPFVLDAIEAAGSLHVDADDASAPGSYDVVLSGEQPDLATVIDGDEVRVVGGEIYTLRDGPWSVEDQDSEMGQVLAFSVQLLSSVVDPRLRVRFLEGAQLTVTEASGSTWVFAGTDPAGSDAQALLTVGSDGLPDSLEVAGDEPGNLAYSRRGEVAIGRWPAQRVQLRIASTASVATAFRAPRASSRQWSTPATRARRSTTTPEHGQPGLPGSPPAGAGLRRFDRTRRRARSGRHAGPDGAASPSALLRFRHRRSGRPGIVEDQRARQAIERARTAGRPPERLLLEERAISDDQLARAVAERYGLDHVDLSTYQIDMAAANLISVATARRYKVLPVGFIDKQTLLVAMADPTNVLAIDDIQISTGLDSKIAVAAEDDIEALIGRLNSLQSAVTEAASEGDEEEEEPAEVSDLEVSAEDAPVIKLVYSILGQAIGEGASDIHFEPGEDEMRVRFRVDGVLREAAHVPKRMINAVVSRVKIMAISTSPRSGFRRTAGWG